MESHFQQSACPLYFVLLGGLTVSLSALLQVKTSYVFPLVDLGLPPLRNSWNKDVAALSACMSLEEEALIYASLTSALVNTSFRGRICCRMTGSPFPLKSTTIANSSPSRIGANSSKRSENPSLQ